MTWHWPVHLFQPNLWSGRSPSHFSFHRNSACFKRQVTKRRVSEVILAGKSTHMSDNNLWVIPDCSWPCLLEVPRADCQDRHNTHIVYRDETRGSKGHILAQRCYLTRDGYVSLNKRHYNHKVNNPTGQKNEMFFALLFLLSRELNKSKVYDLQDSSRLLTLALNRARDKAK